MCVKIAAVYKLGAFRRESSRARFGEEHNCFPSTCGHVKIEAYQCT